jgi:hypothetical protein
MPPLPAYGGERLVVLQERPELRRGSQNILERARRLIPAETSHPCSLTLTRNRANETMFFYLLNFEEC